MGKHTVGPWQWIAEDASLLGLWGPEYGGIDHVLSVHICKACASRNAPCLSPNQADAALIAASPDLLAACEAGLSRIQSDIETDQHKTAEGDQLRAAIAKAVGEAKE